MDYLAFCKVARRLRLASGSRKVFPRFVVYVLYPHQSSAGRPGILGIELGGETATEIAPPLAAHPPKIANRMLRRSGIAPSAC
jgi:hypothetical protein